jgi:hypothetical protein
MGRRKIKLHATAGGPMANPEHLAILKQGVEVWNRWREENPDVDPDLTGEAFQHERWPQINLLSAHLANVHLVDVHLDGADLTDCTLINSELIAVSFRNATLITANLSATRLFRTDFTGADMSDADLTLALIRRCPFSTTSLFRAGLYETTFLDIDLSKAIGLDTCVHHGPSTLDHRTLLRSAELPDVFLRGVGLPDTLIRYLHSLANTPHQFYSCFLSYSTKDEEFATRLHNNLMAAGVRCWFAPHDIKGGRKIHVQIDEAIGTYDRLLLILSDHSMSSEWVKTEIANARLREIREKRQMLFPISLVPFEQIRQWKAFDAETGKDSAREVREYFIPDFSNWKDYNAYQKAFERLLRDLKSEKGKPAVG